MGGGNPSALNWHRPPEREFAAPPAQTERKCLNHQIVLPQGSLSFRAELMKKTS